MEYFDYAAVDKGMNPVVDVNNLTLKIKVLIFILH